MSRPPNPQTREKLLAAAELLILKNGYAATSVDGICNLAGVTKGGFFHYFESKNQIAVEAARQFYDNVKQTLAGAPFQSLRDPVRRVLGYLDFLIDFAQTPEGRQGCLLGNLAQELAASNDEIRDVCRWCFADWTKSLRADLADAKARRSARARWDPHSMADHIVATFEGAILLAKANRDVGVFVSSLKHLKQYLKLLLDS